MPLLLIKHPVSSRFVCFAFVLKLLCGSEVVFPQNTHRHRWIKLLTLVVVADLNTSDWPMHSHAQYKTSAKKIILQIKHVDAMGVTLISLEILAISRILFAIMIFAKNYKN